MIKHLLDMAKKVISNSEVDGNKLYFSLASKPLVSSGALGGRGDREFDPPFSILAVLKNILEGWEDFGVSMLQQKDINLS